MIEKGQLVQELDAKVYRKIAGVLRNKQTQIGVNIEIQRKKKQGKWIIELWSTDVDKARKAIDDVLKDTSLYEKTTVKAPEKLEKEPLLEISEKNDYLEVLAELPGVKEEDIQLKIEAMLKISAKDKEYSQVLPYPAKIISTTFKNNVLCVKLKKKE